MKLGLSNPFDEKGIRLVSKRNDIRLSAIRQPPHTCSSKTVGWRSLLKDFSPETVFRPSCRQVHLEPSVIRRDFQSRHSVIASLDAALLERKDPETGKYLTWGGN